MKTDYSILPAMSEDQLKAFLEAVKADAGLLEKLKDAVDPDAVVAIAKEAGFVISAEGISDEEVSEKELESVAGGGKMCVTKTPFKSIIKM
jgi:predicted ribosomally synthesized peptide with nif11-like leader